MKIVRTQIKVKDLDYYFDRPYVDDKDDATNCDDAIAYLNEKCDTLKHIPAMLMASGIMVTDSEGKQRHDPFYNAQPAILNLPVIDVILIENVGVYEVE